jgi:hypothetical protein
MNRLGYIENIGQGILLMREQMMKRNKTLSIFINYTLNFMPNKLAKNFKPLFWGYDFNSIDPSKDQRIIITNTLNYGNLKQWRELNKIYGKKKLRKIIQLIPKSEFREQVLKLIKLLFNINKFQYASRSAQIQAKRNI